MRTDIGVPAHVVCTGTKEESSAETLHAYTPRAVCMRVCTISVSRRARVYRRCKTKCKQGRVTGRVRAVSESERERDIQVSADLEERDAVFEAAPRVCRPRDMVEALHLRRERKRDTPWAKRAAGLTHNRHLHASPAIRTPRPRAMFRTSLLNQTGLRIRALGSRTRAHRNRFTYPAQQGIFGRRHRGRCSNGPGQSSPTQPSGPTARVLLADCAAPLAHQVPHCSSTKRAPQQRLPSEQLLTLKLMMAAQPNRDRWGPRYPPCVWPDSYPQGNHKTQRGQHATSLFHADPNFT